MPTNERKFPPCDNVPCADQPEGVILYSPNCNVNVPCLGYESNDESTKLYPPNCPNTICPGDENKPLKDMRFEPNCNDEILWCIGY